MGNLSVHLYAWPPQPRAGSYQLPALSLQWWDINNRRWVTTELAEETLEIFTSDSAKTNEDNRAALLALAMLAGALLLLSGGLLVQQSLTPKRQNTEKRAWRRLRKTVSQGNSVDIRHAVLNWVHSFNPSQPPRRSEEMAAQHPDLEKVLSTLERDIFSRQNSIIPDANTTMKVLTQVRKRILDAKAIDRGTTGLYPAPDK